MTIETYKFTNETVFEALQTFCLINSIKKEEFCAALPEIISREIIFDNQTISTGHCFKIKWNHDFCEPLAEYLDHRYTFESRFEKTLGFYDDFFNKNPRKDCYYVNGHYAFDMDQRLRKVYSFDFTDIELGNDYMRFLEFDDTNLLSLETRIFDYYFQYFGNNNTPDELKRPLSQLSKEEISLLQMIYI
jgi:hypothetical protein